ncbi:hypothetical protein C1645_787546 [Glomus cerebriforme]|uniref:Uncharacterized protein n=1 Tax=Glomus cerebriforme TaxID=658196 RepID=A0A397SBK7_9GLOM|nr:hypothetical protein C1645_787546 [Glomus cerebriforme]
MKFYIQFTWTYRFSVNFLYNLNVQFDIYLSYYVFIYFYFLPLFGTNKQLFLYFFQFLHHFHIDIQA